MKKNVLIIGDPMIDIYHIGKIDRISPEAPIPIFEEIDRVEKLGGAANAAANIKSIMKDRAEVHFMIPENLDQDSVSRLRKLFYDQNLQVNILYSPAFKFQNTASVIEKHRFVDSRNKHQVGIRFDTEKYINKDKKYYLTNGYINDLWRQNFSPDVVVFSDYVKGCFDFEDAVKSMFSKIGENCHTILDSRRKSLVRFNKCTYFKPNMKEYEIYLDDRRNGTYFEKIIRTESEKGISYLEDLPHYKEPLIISSYPALNKNIVDTTGAGDTSLAAIVYGVLNSLDIPLILKLSNHLSSIACSKFGTYIVSQDDLQSSFKAINEC